MIPDSGPETPDASDCKPHPSPGSLAPADPHISPQGPQDLAALSLEARTAWLLRHFGLRARKSMGQNFLIDAHHAARIADAALAAAPRRVIEIGGGLGALSLPLAQAGVDLTVYELDRGLAEALTWLLSHLDNAQVLNADLLKADLIGGPDAVAVGNLPYYITTPIIERLFAARPHFDALVVTVQREVGERIRAQPGTKAYGPLTLWCRYHAETIDLLSRLPAPVFSPQPSVDSVALRMSLRGGPPPGVDSEAGFFAAVRAGLGQRRKTLLNGLRGDPRLSLSAEQARAALSAAGIDGSRRGETLDFDEFVRLGNELAPHLGADA